MIKILVVDDDQNFANLTKILLDKKGYDVFLIHDSLRVIEGIKRYKPDLILMDVMMPQLSGIELVTLLRNHRSYEFQASEFGGFLEEIAPLLSKLGQPTDKFTDIENAIDWLNTSIEPFLVYINHIKMNNKSQNLFSRTFETMTESRLRELAVSPEGQELKRAILSHLYPREMPKRQNPGLKDIPVVILTGLISEEESNGANVIKIEGSNYQFLGKPFETDHLFKVIEHSLDEARRY